MSMKAIRLLAACCTALATMTAAGQTQAPDGKTIFKGKLKPGLYEQVDRSEIRGLAGAPKEGAKGTETKQRCLTQAELDKGLEFRPECKFMKYEDTGSAVNLSSLCPDGSTSDFKLAANADGFTSEMSAKGRNADGSAFSVSMKSEARYLGPCEGR